MNKAPIEHEELRAAIAELGGQKAVATRFGIPYRTVQNWYRGERTPPEYVARMLVQYNEDEIHHLTTEMYNQDTISELRRSNKDLMERDKADTKRYIEDQEALAWYESELCKAKTTIENQREEINLLLHSLQQLEDEAHAYRKLWEEAEQEVEKQKKAREVWVRQVGMLTK